MEDQSQNLEDILLRVSPCILPSSLINQTHTSRSTCGASSFRVWGGGEAGRRGVTR